MKVQLDMYQTLAIAVLVLLLGSYLRKKIKFLERFCIPAPVVGGLLFAIFTCICYVTHILEFSFDDTLKEVCMVFFFTSVGFQANLKVLKKGGKLAAAEFREGQTPMGPPPSHRVGEEVLKARFEAAGFRRINSFALGENLYCSVFEN